MSQYPHPNAPISVPVELPIEWRRSFGGSREVIATGQTIGDCLDSLAARYPLGKERIAGRYDVFINWQHSRLFGGRLARLAPGDRLQIVPLRA